MNVLNTNTFKTHAVIISALLTVIGGTSVWGEGTGAIQNELLSQEANVEFNSAVNLQNTNHAEEALKKFETVLKKHPNSGIAEGAIGTMLLKLGRPAEAIPHLERAVQLDPTTYTIGSLSVALMSTGNNDRAKAILEKEVGKHPDNASALGNLISANISTGNLEDALKCSMEFVRRFPTHEAASGIRENAKGIEAQIALKKQHAADSGQQDYYAELGQDIYTWPKSRMPIKVYMHPGTGVPGFLPAFDNALREAFATWQDASQGSLSFEFVESPKNADITCYWVADPKQLRGGGEQGLATLNRDGKHIGSAKIDFLTTPIGLHGYAISTVDALVMKRVCLHEVGHVLGIAGHSPYVDDTMYFSEVGTKDVALTQRDINTIRRIYQ